MFDSTCPGTLACEMVFDVFGGGTTFNACVGCSTADSSLPCRSSEVCNAPILPFPGFDQTYCGPEGTGFPFP